LTIRQPAPSLSFDVSVLEHKTGAAGVADALAELVGGGSGISADPHLVEWPIAPMALD
jgi:hypothetical protein